MVKVAKSALLLMMATMLAKILGFGRELVLASSYGASMYSDAYLIALNIPLVIFSIIGSTLNTVLIPMYFDISNNKGEKDALKYINNILTIVVIICVILSLLGIIFTEPLVKLFAIGFKGESLKVAIKFTRIITTGIIFNGLSYIFTAYLQIKGNFVIPGLMSIPRNIIVIISIILSVKYNPYIMIWGTLIGIIIEFLFQVPFAKREGYKYKFELSLNDEYTKKTMWLIAPVLIGVAVNQINTMVDRTLASTLVEGSISALNYANRLNLFVMNLFITSIAAVIYPMLSNLSTNNEKEAFNDSVVKSVNSVSLLIIPISIGAIVLSKPIVKILFQRGEFDERATIMTSIALIMYSIGMIGTGLRDILGRVFYSIQDTKIPMINGAISMVINIILNIILVKFLGIAGLALATSLSSIIGIILLFISLKRKIGYFGQDKIFKTMIKSIISSIVMGIGTYYSYIYIVRKLGLGMNIEIIAVILSILVGVLIYGSLVYLFKIEEIKIATDMVLKKLKKVK